MSTERHSLDALVPELHTGLKFSKRQSSGSASHLLEEPESGRFYSLGVHEYQLLSHVDGRKTIRQIFDSYLARHCEASASEPSDSLLTWDQACRLFEFLSTEKLLATINGAAISDTSQPADQRWIQNVNPIGIRIRLMAGDELAANLAKRLNWIVSPWAVAVWVFTMLWAAALLVGDYAHLLADAKTIIQPENLILLTVCWLFLKVIHESAHAITCKHFGGKVGDVGINFLLLLPMPFVDVTNSWKFESKWKRISVAFAGVYAELFVAAIFVMIWTYTDSPVLSLISVQVIFMASLTTLLFNINPLMKFDGYFILSDLINRPNLATNGERYRKNWLKSTLFGIQSREDFSTFDRTTKVYGWLASLWRIVVAVGLIIAAATLFHGAGIVLAALAVFLWYLRPLAMFLIDLWKTPGQLSWIRCGVTTCSIGLILFLSTWIPWPFAPVAHGVVEFSEQHFVRANSSGFMTRLYVEPGQKVKAGDLLAEFENRELEYKYQSLQIDRQVSILEARKLKREKKLAEYQAEQQRIKNLSEQIAVLKEQTGKLALIAPCNGYVVANDLQNKIGSFYEKGDSILKVVPTYAVQVVSCAEEFNAPLFRAATDQKVMIEFESGVAATTTLESMEPTAIREVIHPALSAESGGPLAVQHDDEGGTKLVEPIFKVTTAALNSDSVGSKPLLAGQRCRLFLVDQSHNCWSAVQYKVGNWLKRHWESATATQ